MWVDAAKEGRQTNWKYVMILLITALAALVCLWAVEHPLEIRLFDLHRSDLLEGTWTAAPCAPESGVCAIGDLLYLAEDASLTVLDADLKTVFSQDFSGEINLYAGEFALACVPSAKEVGIIKENGLKTLEFPGGVDAVFTGKDHFAVITAGSGYLTNTVLYTGEGTMSGQIGLVDEAMISGAFLDDLFAGLSFGKDGVWYLGWYTPAGVMVQKSAVDALQCFELRSLGDMLVIRTQDELLFYEKAGDLVERVSFGTAEFVSWDFSENDFLALVVRSRGKYRLKTLLESGQLLGETELPMEIRDLAVSGNRVLVLDPETLRIYDAFCATDAISDLGARAAQIAAGENKIWLLGNGELMKLIDS